MGFVQVESDFHFGVGSVDTLPTGATASHVTKMQRFGGNETWARVEEIGRIAKILTIKFKETIFDFDVAWLKRNADCPPFSLSHCRSVRLSVLHAVEIFTKNLEIGVSTKLIVTARIRGNVLRKKKLEEKKILRKKKFWKKNFRKKIWKKKFLKKKFWKKKWKQNCLSL